MIVVELPSERRIFSVFYMSIIRRDNLSFFSQDIINSEYDYQANEIISDNEKNEEWVFEEILDSYNIPEDFQYKIKWPYFYRPTWELIVNV